MRIFLALLLVAPVISPATARDLHVDPVAGDDSSLEGPYRTISVAIRRAEPGDTIHLEPMVYRDYAGFYGIRGEPGKPITLDGHGATLDGSDPLDPEQWEEIEPGLYRADDLLKRIDDAMIQRWFFRWNGRMVHMGRTSKGPRAPLKQPGDLEPGEWTFVKDLDRENAGSFFLKLADGSSLAEERIFVPMRSAGVQFSGSKEKGTHNAHLVIRNLTATHPYNDGFNIHGHCEDVRFENIRAIECGDDGISAHETAEYSVHGFVSIGNSTGICDTGSSKTVYDRVFIRDCRGFDLFFLDTGRYSVRNAVILSSAAQVLTVTGRNNRERPCSLTLENVLIHRTATPGLVRIEANSRLAARRITLRGLSLTARAGRVSLRKSAILGSGEEIRIHPDVEWESDGNTYDLKQLRHGEEVFSRAEFARFQERLGQDSHSTWISPGGEVDEGGADWEELKRLVVPAEERQAVEDRLNAP